MREIDLSLNRLNNFKFNLPPVIHIAGTNGKGSTLSFIKTILQYANYSVHSYSSPFIWHLNESIELNNQCVSIEMLEKRLKQFETYNLTPFEHKTMTAFSLFQDYKADFLLLETGMGGRLDATNIVKNPLMTIITSIAFDHEEFLGNTIEQIAFEKAGIIKQNVPCYISKKIPEKAKKIIFEVARTKNATVHICLPYTKKISLHGDYQKDNAGIAATCLRPFIDENIIEKGIQETKWIGRFQKIHYYNRNIIIDGAHNISGIESFCKNLEPNFHAIVAIGKQKNYKAMLDVVQKYTSHIYYFDPKNYQELDIYEYNSPQELSSYCPGFIKETLKEIISLIPHNKTIVLMGSLYVLRIIDKKYFI